MVVIISLESFWWTSNARGNKFFFVPQCFACRGLPDLVRGKHIRKIRSRRQDRCWCHFSLDRLFRFFRQDPPKNHDIASNSICVVGKQQKSCISIVGQNVRERGCAGLSVFLLHGWRQWYFCFYADHQTVTAQREFGGKG